MPGMNSGLDISDPAVVAAFKAALVHQGLIALLIFSLVGLTWITIRAGLPAAAAPGAGGGRGGAGLAAAAAHRVRPAMGLRRDLAGPAEDGDRAPVAGDRADR